MWDVGCGMWDVGCGMWDAGCGMWDAKSVDIGVTGHFAGTSRTTDDALTLTH
jgi:hypothetical protein